MGSVLLLTCPNCKTENRLYPPKGGRFDCCHCGREITFVPELLIDSGEILRPADGTVRVDARRQDANTGY